MPISTIGQNGLNAPITLTSPVINTVTSAASTALTLQSAGTTAITVDTSQNVGIGTVSPAQELHLYRSSGATDMLIEQASSGNAYVHTKKTSREYAVGTKTDVLAFIDLTADAERMRIDSSGNLLVGLTAQRVTEKFNATATSAESRTEVAVFENSSESSGKNGIRVFIGSGGNNTSTYHFRGETRGHNNWYLYGNGTTSYSSDIRLKKNVQTARGYLEDLNKLRVVKYQWKGENPDCQQVELGLIAQEVEEVFPNLIQEHEVEGVGDIKNIKQSVLPFMMLKAIQELKTIVDAQAAEIAELKAKVA